VILSGYCVPEMLLSIVHNGLRDPSDDEMVRSLKTEGWEGRHVSVEGVKLAPNEHDLI